MLDRAVLPDLVARSGSAATIRSRTLRTWGLAESALAELIAPRLEALDLAGNPTIAFLASGIEGIKVRVTARGSGTDPEGHATALIDAEEAELRALLGSAVFGTDDETMEAAVGRLLVAGSKTLGLAESVTGRPDRQPLHRRARRQRLVPGLGRLLRHRREARRPRRRRRGRGQRDGGAGDGRGGPPGAAAPTWGWP